MKHFIELATVLSFGGILTFWLKSDINSQKKNKKKQIKIKDKEEKKPPKN
jgi:hypothetical protein